GIYMGKEGRKTLERTLSLDLDVEKQNEAADVIALTVADAQEAEAFREGTKLDARVELGTKPVFPVVFRKPPGDTARVLRDKEATFLARVLTAISRTKEWGLDEDDVQDEVGGRLIVTVKGPTTNPEILRSYDAPPPASAIGPETERLLHEAKRTKRLLVRFADGKLTAMDPREKEVLLDEPVEGDSAAAASLLVSELAELGILPREIWTDTPSLDEPLAVLGPFGVKVQVKLELKELRRARGA
ncbi:MAG TPA: hypothetical protein VFF73_21665, partial [Planctomycetota bacterium]|nr:hypothetical protein [Planctomycetota bacterium]